MTTKMNDKTESPALPFPIKFCHIFFVKFVNHLLHILRLVYKKFLKHTKKVWIHDYKYCYFLVTT